MQIRAQYLAARKTRELEILALDAEQKKFKLGASTIYLVIQAQRDLATAEGGEVSAMANYMRANTQMELVTGQTLTAHNIKLDEARMGSVSRSSGHTQAVACDGRVWQSKLLQLSRQEQFKA